MKLFLIFTTMVVSTCASPMPDLLHPSPVNPDVLVAIKPEEKIFLITDPKEIAKFKRETTQPFYPTVLPNENVHQIRRRDSSIPHQTHGVTHEEMNDNKSNDEMKHAYFGNRKVVGVHEPQTLLLGNPTPSTEQHKRDIPVPLVPKEHRREETSKESTEIESDKYKNEEHLEHQQVKTNSEEQQHKRDIPVPLVPKYHHPEETPKDSDEQESNKNVSSKSQQIPITPEQRQDEISKKGQQMTQASSKEIDESLQQQKRELPISSTSMPESHTDEHFPSDNEKSTTEHPLARPHPVPVAELFARDHGN